MNGNPKLSPNDTFIFEEDDLNQLDELSLTSVLGEVSGTLEHLDPEPQRETQHPEEKPTDDPTIDDLLLDSAASDVQANASSDPETEDTGTFRTMEVMLAPELLFPDEGGDEDL